MTKFTPSKPLLLVLFVWMFVQPAISSNYMGGEITWECTPQGNFRFTMKLYRECYNPNGTAPNTFPMSLNLSTNISTMTSIGMTRVAVRELTPGCGCPNGMPLSCTGMSNGTSNMGALEEWVYTSDNAYPSGVPLTGIPPSSGWRFSYTGCCRSASDNIIGTPNFCLQSWMFPYQNTPVNNCFDHSPKFMESPASVGYTQQPFIYNPLVYDQDGDQTVFGWSNLYTMLSIAVTDYTPGYSFTSPLPGVIHHANNTPATLNQATGLIELKSYTNGAFALAVIATSYKNGIKVAQVFRDIKIILLSDTTNHPPVHQITPALIQVKHNHYRISVDAEDSLTFQLQLTDTDTCPGSGQAHQIWLKASSEQFNSTITGTPCLNPPCAVLSPSPTSTNPLIGAANLTTTFTWRTGSQHTAQSGDNFEPTTHLFVFDYQDDHCPYPGQGRILVEVEVVPSFLKNRTDFSCISVEPNGYVRLNWRRSLIPDSLFVRYEIASSIYEQGPYATLAQLTNPNTTTFLHATPTPVAQRYYYKMTTHYHDYLVPYLTTPTPASSILLKLTPYGALSGKVQLNWNFTHPEPVNGATGVYEVFRDNGTGIWEYIANTTSNSYMDQLVFVNQFVRYRIETVNNDTSGTLMPCKTISNIATVFLNSIENSDVVSRAPIIFPNPNRGTFALDPGDLQGDATIRIIKSDGSLVHQLNATLIPNQPCTIAIPGLAGGLYWVHIITGRGEYSLRMKNEE